MAGKQNEFLWSKLSENVKKVAAKKAPHTYDPQTKALAEANGQDCDWTDKVLGSVGGLFGAGTVLNEHKRLLRFYDSNEQ